MNPTTTGQFRVLRAPDESGDLVLVDRADFEPTMVTLDGSGGVESQIRDGLRSGYVIDAKLVWSDGTARLDECSVCEWTLFAFRDRVTNLFEDALDTWAEAQQQGIGVNSRVTFSNDGIPNGALYTFAEQPGAVDIFAEFRDGRRPLEPLLDRVDSPPPYETFIFRPATHDFILVYVVLNKESILADTVRDTYDCPRPTEPLRE